MISWNIQGMAQAWREGHLERVGETLMRLDPDIAGLQEVHQGTRYANGARQGDLLAQRLGMALAFGASLVDWGGEYGNAVLTKGRIVSSAVHPLPVAGLEPRSLLHARVSIGETSVGVFVTHLTHSPFARTIRMAQVKEIVEVVRPTAGAYFVMGDLNAGWRAAEVKFLHQELSSKVFAYRLGRTHPATLRQLDYLLPSPAWRRFSARVVQEGPSDHWPIVAEVEP